jgi:Helix-turn-helix domain
MRKKTFTLPAVPLDRNLKAKLLWRARALMRATEKGKHYGEVTAKAYAVYAALLMGFHNCRDGRCFPSYERLAEAAGCCRASIAPALRALEECGLVTVWNRLVRVRWRDPLALATRERVMRTSNCYAFPAPAGQGEKSPLPRENSSKAKLPSGTPKPSLSSELFDALNRLQRGIGVASRPLTG